MKKVTRKITKWLSYFALATFPIFYPIYAKAPASLVETLSSTLTEQEAKEIILKQKKKLGIKEDVKLYVLEDNSFSGYKGFCARSENGNGFYIAVEEDELNKTNLKHEMYHIYRDSKFIKPSSLEGVIIKLNSNHDEGKRNFMYDYIYEPRACLYSFTGIKL